MVPLIRPVPFDQLNLKINKNTKNNPFSAHTPRTQPPLSVLSGLYLYHRSSRRQSRNVAALHAAGHQSLLLLCLLEFQLV
ncbi:hypothetical protein ACOSQ3_014653 [Xanthoceras sorbifolium]